MTECLSIYKCSVCGNLIQVILPGEGELVCCGQPMKLLNPKTNETSEIEEKHVPIFVNKNENCTEIKIGSTLHPMSEEHYIQFSEVISKDGKCLKLKYYSAGDIPIMNIENDDNSKKALAYCNIHGLWEGTKND